MELYIGGRASGKLDIVKRKNSEILVIDEKNFRSFLDAKGSREELSKEEASKWLVTRLVINHLHLIIREMLKDSYKTSDIISRLLKIAEYYPDIIIISDEIGNGIVPVDEFERLYREETGRILIEVAKNCDRVWRVICGIEMRIK